MSCTFAGAAEEVECLAKREEISHGRGVNLRLLSELEIPLAATSALRADLKNISVAHVEGNGFLSER
jgi:hypothetical protein